jgi:hypothetical protein
MEQEEKQKSSIRQRAEEIKPYRCKNLIAVIECINGETSEAKSFVSRQMWWGNVASASLCLDCG